MKTLILILSSVLPFLGVPLDPATLGTAGAGSASLRPSVYANPASVVCSEHATLIYAGYQLWAPSDLKSNDFVAGLSQKLSSRLSLTGSVLYMGGSSYSLYDATGNPSGDFSPWNLAASIGAGYRLGDALSAGVNLWYAHEADAPGVSMVGFAADAFVRYSLNPSLALSAGVLSVGPSVKGEGGASYSLPSSARLAVTWTAPVGEFHTLEADADADFYFGGGASVAAGADFRFRNMFSLRAGYRYSGDGAVLPSFASLGLGLHWKGLRLDLAWLTASSTLGGSLSAGLSLCF